MKLAKWLGLPDMHIPYHDPRSIDAVLSYAEDTKPWDGCILFGDLLDFNEISHFVIGRPGDVREKIRETFDSGNHLLDQIQNQVQPSRLILLEGNHEYRAVDYMIRHPELDGMLNVAHNLFLQDRGIEWVENWSQGHLFNVGNAYFSHGRYINEHHAKKMVLRYGVNVYYGHTHDVQEFPLVQYGRDKTIVGKSLGCLCSPDQRYLKGEPTNWQQAFAVFYFFPDGFYTEHTVRIFKHRFVSPEGVVYDWSKTKKRGVRT